MVSTINSTHLTKNGIKSICEASDFSIDMRNTKMLLQVVDVNMFDEKNQKKNMKARVMLSDGVSRMISLITTKAF